MKKIIILLATLVFGLGMAGTAVAESPFFAKTVFIEKIISTQQGYQVDFLNDRGHLVKIYVPIEWFYKETGATTDGFVKAEVVYGNGPQFPYMEIFWKNGVFDHLRIFANANYADPSWGVLPDTVDISSKFDPKASLNFDFNQK